MPCKECGCIIFGERILYKEGKPYQVEYCIGCGKIQRTVEVDIRLINAVKSRLEGIGGD